MAQVLDIYALLDPVRAMTLIDEEVSGAQILDQWSVLDEALEYSRFNALFPNTLDHWSALDPTLAWQQMNTALGPE
jgi:hypothetical protein